MKLSISSNHIFKEIFILFSFFFLNIFQINHNFNGENNYEFGKKIIYSGSKNTDEEKFRSHKALTLIYSLTRTREVGKFSNDKKKRERER